MGPLPTRFTNCLVQDAQVVAPGVTFRETLAGR
jgi:hypothetical protein